MKYMSKLIGEGGFGCIFYPGIKCNGTTDKVMHNATKIQRQDFNSKNESVVGSILKQLPSYPLFFLPVLSSCSIDLRKVTTREIKKCKLIKNYKDDYVAMNLPFLHETKFIDIIQNKPANEIIMVLIETFQYLLMGLEKLRQLNVIHYDLKIENVLFKYQTHEPIIIDFGISIPLDRVNEKTMPNYFYVFLPEYYVWCLEINIICYLLHETDSVLTEDEALFIADLYVKHNKGLEGCTQSFKDTFLKQSIEQVKRYVKQPRTQVIQELLSHRHTWDNYSLSIMYLKLLQSFFSQFNIQHTFITHLNTLLLINIHPDPTKRLTIQETAERYSQIFYMDDDVNSYVELTKLFTKARQVTVSSIRADMNTLKSQKNETSN